MPRIRPLAGEHTDREFTDGVAAILADLELPVDFPADALTEAQAVVREVALPDADHTDKPFVTIDPPGARDLDQAVFIERDGGGFVVWYAIADVAAFVRPGGALALEAQRRGETVYAPDRRLPLHPPVISEEAASLLPGQERSALVWELRLDDVGELTHAHVERGRVRSRAQYEYAAVQRALDDERADEVFELLRTVGLLRLELERERGGVSLALPDQEVVVLDGHWSLAYAARLPVEQWNAEISLLTGMAAAQLMLYAEVGIVRTLPEPSRRTVARLRRTAAALAIDWPQPMDYPDFVRTLRPDQPEHAAMMRSCASLLRGAGYVNFQGGVPEQPGHAALATTYAHATAPLRRLVDRYVGEVCLALCADREVPRWITSELSELPATMAGTRRRVAAFERAVLDLVEAGLLADRVGETFAAVVVEIEDDDARRGVVVVRDPAVEAPVRSAEPLPLGKELQVRLVVADPEARRVVFDLDVQDQGLGCRTDEPAGRPRRAPSRVLAEEGPDSAQQGGG